MYNWYMFVSNFSFFVTFVLQPIKQTHISANKILAIIVNYIIHFPVVIKPQDNYQFNKYLKILYAYFLQKYLIKFSTERSPRLTHHLQQQGLLSHLF